MLTKKDVQCESCELSFIWGKMRIAAQEIALQLVLRDCSKEAVGEGQLEDFGEGGVQCHQVFTLQEIFC